MWIIDSIGAEDRKVDNRPYAEGEGNGIGERCVHGPFNQIEIIKGPQAQIHKIQSACFLETDGNFFGILQGQPPPGMHLIGI